jgi:hypothetical protein
MAGTEAEQILLGDDAGGDDVDRVRLSLCCARPALSTARAAYARWPGRSCSGTAAGLSGWRRPCCGTPLGRCRARRAGVVRPRRARHLTTMIVSVSLAPEAFYLQLGSLVAEMPDLANGEIMSETNRWLGRAIALIEQNDPFDVNLIALRSSSQFLRTNRTHNAQVIAAIVHEALAKAELAAPAAVQGTFIAGGHPFVAYAAVSKVLDTAKTDLSMIDPYADEKLLRKYALSAPVAVSVRILTDAEYSYKSLRPAAENWVSESVSTRPRQSPIAWR